jgi:hypothetical protein
MADITDPIEQRRIREHGVRLVLHLDLDTGDPDGEYVRADEPGDRSFVLNREESAAIFRLVNALAARGPGAALQLHDDAAVAVLALLDAGVDRQAFMRPLLWALMERTHYGGGRFEDPLAGYASFAQRSATDSDLRSDVDRAVREASRQLED